MNQILTPAQIADLRHICELCHQMNADLVIIGATALLLSIGDIGRFTRDVDLTVALDLDGFAQLTEHCGCDRCCSGPTSQACPI